MTIKSLLLTASPILLLASCTPTVPTPPKVDPINPDSQVATPKIIWSLANVKSMDSTSNESDLYMLVNGKSHLIATKVPSLKEQHLGGPLKPSDLRRYGALSGYSFEWHVSGDTYYVKQEGKNLAVFLEGWSDENEGSAWTKRVKTISL